jgi:hypothetical protein
MAFLQLGVHVRLLEEHHVDEGDEQVGSAVFATQVSPHKTYQELLPIHSLHELNMNKTNFAIMKLP